MSELHRIIRDAQPIGKDVNSIVTEVIEVVLDEFKKEDKFFQIYYVIGVLNKLKENKL